MPAAPLLEFRQLTALNGGVNGVHDIDLTVRLGEHVALLGPNGSGKSTIIRTITRDLYPQPVDGVVCRLFGEETWDVFDLKRRLGIVSNDLQSWCARDMTATEMILSGFFSSIGLWPANEITDGMREKARTILADLGVAHLADRTLTQVSSGEARRLLIGRALVHDPMALLLDEPTNSLDFRAAHEFREVVRRLAQAGRTILMVTHTVADILPEIERVILLRAGRIFRDGPKAEVLTSANLSALFEMPVRVDSAGGYFSLSLQVARRVHAAR
jgi:iron complex transport system ATP-binding protein